MSQVNTFNGGAAIPGDTVKKSDLKNLVLYHTKAGESSTTAETYDPLTGKTLTAKQLIIRQSGQELGRYDPFDDSNKTIEIASGSKLYTLSSSGLSDTATLFSNITADLQNGVEPIIEYTHSGSKTGYFHLGSYTSSSYTFHGTFGSSSYYELVISSTGTLTEITYATEPEVFAGLASTSIATMTTETLIPGDTDANPCTFTGRKYQVNVDLTAWSLGTGTDYCVNPIWVNVGGVPVFTTYFTVDDSIDIRQSFWFSFCTNKDYTGQLSVTISNMSGASQLNASVKVSCHSIDVGGSGGGGGGGGSSTSTLKAMETFPLLSSSQDIAVYLNNGNWNVAVGFLVIPSGDIDLSDGNLALEYRVIQGGTDASAVYRFLLYELDDATESQAVQEANLVAYGASNHPSGNYGTCFEQLTLVSGVTKIDGTKKYYVVFLTDSTNFWTYTGVHLAGVWNALLNVYPQMCGHITSPASVDASALIENIGTIQFGSWSVSAIPYFRLINKSVTERKM